MPRTDPVLLFLASALLTLAMACGDSEPIPPESATASPPSAPPSKESVLRARARAVLGELPDQAPAAGGTASAALVALGRVLYHDPRLSQDGDISCATCHGLSEYGVDGLPTSRGHRGQVGSRNAPTVYNAALHASQFWDGRSPDVEDQAKGPILNPVEMAMTDGDAVMARVDAIPGYAELFRAAFPGEQTAATYDNLGTAIGAFERQLLTPGPLDAWLRGDDEALTGPQREGLATFLDVGCATCHGGPAVGGTLYMKLGLVRPYEDDDPGRQAVTGLESDRQVFKVPSLRNVAETGPWFHDGSVTELDDAIARMGAHQLGLDLTPTQLASIAAFLEALTGPLPDAWVAAPAQPG